MERGAGPAAAEWRRFAIVGGPAPCGPPPWAALRRDGLALRALATLGSEARPPADIRAFADATFAANIVRRDELRAIGEAFDGIGPAVALKGASRLLADPATARTRPMTDIDLLVAPDAFERAQHALAAIGFEALDEGRPVSTRWTCEVELRRARAGFSSAVDLHRGMHHGRLWRTLSDALMQDAVPCGAVCVPCDADMILVAAAHRARHAFRGDLREIADVWDVLAGGGAPPATELASRARSLHAHGAVWALLHELREIVGPHAHLDAPLEALRQHVPTAQRARLSHAIRVAHPWTVGHQAGQAPGFVSMYLPLVDAGVRRRSVALGIATHGLLRVADHAFVRLTRPR